MASFTCFLVCFFNSKMPVVGSSTLLEITNRNNLGNLSNREKVKDYVVLFVLTFLFARFLTMTAVAIMVTTVLAFHLIRGLNYHEDATSFGVASILTADHVKYFFGTYLFCICYMQAYRMWKARKNKKRLSNKAVKRARLKTGYRSPLHDMGMDKATTEQMDVNIQQPIGNDRDYY